MAGFKTHISFGTFLAFFFAILAYVWDWTTDVYSTSIIFISTLVGSFLPDVDHDSGIPARIIFHVLALVAAGVSFYFIYNIDDDSLLLQLLLPLSAFLIMAYVLAPIFKKTTVHRGIFHSLPAMVISFFLTLLIVNELKINLLNKFLFAFSIALGYFGHLFLDEIYSAQTLFGKKRRVKKSFGTAISFRSKSLLITVFAYALLLGLVYFSYPIFEKILHKLD